MKTWTVVVVGACWLAVILGWKRLMDAVAPRDLDVRHPGEVWDGIEDVDSLD